MRGTLFSTFAILCFSCLLPQPPWAAGGEAGGQLAFPSAEGYGRFAKGGRGGDVYHVANLEDAGPGSLRHGIQSAQGPRTIVFDISGTIDLATPLVIDKSFLTIAGQTATAGGITLKGGTLLVRNCSDLVLRYLRIRVGDKTPQTGEDIDGMQTLWVKNSIYDHLSISWGIDNNHDSDYTDDFTLQWCISSEPLNDSIHPEGPHAMCSSYMNLEGNMTVHHNLYATGRERHPTLGASVEPKALLDFRNNVIYNWRGTANVGSDQVYLISNYFKPGPETDPEVLPIAMKGRHPTKANGFMRGNIFEGHPEWTKDNYSALDFERWLYPGSKYQYQGSLLDWKLEQPEDLGHHAPQTDSAEDAFKRVLGSAGASAPRDAVDERIMADVRNGTGRVIDSQEDVGGWPVLKLGTPPVDSDRDGMPDPWELENQFDPQNPEDRNADEDRDGYTNLEEYLNSLVGE